jgi:hypothetical protein
MMKTYIWLAALLAVGTWGFTMSGNALAHGGSDFAVADCEDEDDGEDSQRAVLDCEDEDGEDSQRAILDCEDEDGEDTERVLDCEDEDSDEGTQRAVLDCEDENHDESD